MALHPNFPSDPHAMLDPALRWFPVDEALRTSSFEKLLPPFVPSLRKDVKAWRDRGYEDASETSQSLLTWWFKTHHLLQAPVANVLGSPALQEFQYFFAQREALETIIYLIDVVDVKDKFDLMRYDSSGAVSSGMFDETWRRAATAKRHGVEGNNMRENCSGIDRGPEIGHVTIGRSASFKNCRGNLPPPPGPSTRGPGET